MRAATRLRSGPRRLAPAWLAAVLLACSPGAGAATDPLPAQWLLRGGAIYTQDAARSWAEALAIRDGRIAFVGTDREAAAHVDASTRITELAGRMVLPGIHDVHVHPIGSGIEARACDLNGLATVAEYLDAIRACAAAQPQAPWITGGGWLMSAFGPGAMPSRKLLDAIESERPVYLPSADGHTAWVNSRALEIAGIARETPDPPDGRIDRDPATGEAIGSLQEGAVELVARHVPSPTPEERLAGLRHAVALLNGFGITAVQDAAAGEADLETYAALEAAGALSLRVVCAQWWEREAGLEQIGNLERLRARYTRGRLDAGTVKIMQDGVIENYTAALLEPYRVEGSPRGIAMLAPARLAEAVVALDARGFRVHFHAIGDAAVRQSLDAVAAARVRNGASGLRHHIAHLQLVHPDDLPRFRTLGVGASFQPLWAYPDEYITELALPFVGPARGARMYPIGSLQASGAMIAFGSDWSVSSANPFLGIEVAVRRADPDLADGRIHAPDERISLAEALAAYTIQAAWVNGLERETGSLEPGKAADLVVIDRNLFAIDPREISETRVLLTLLEGQPVHGDPAAL